MPTAILQGKKTLEELTKGYPEVARKEKLPDEWTKSSIQLLRGPYATIEALGTLSDWGHPAPGDPGSDLTLHDLANLFKNAHEDWKQSKTALDNFWNIVMADPAKYESATAAVKAVKWQDFYTTFDSQLKEGTPGRHLVLHGAEMWISLAEKGLLKEALIEHIKASTKSSMQMANAYGYLAQGRYPTSRHKVWDDEYATDTAALAGGSTVMTICTAASVTASHYEAFGVAIGCFGIAGVGLGVAGYAAYRLYRYYN